MMRFVLVLFVVLGLTGCAGFRQGATYRTYKQRMLATDSDGGASRLQIEADYDPSVRSYVKGFGKPDFIYVVSMYELYFFYLSPVRCVRFSRPVFTTISEIEILDAIPRDYLAMIRQLRPASGVVASGDTTKKIKVLSYQYVDKTRQGVLVIDMAGHGLSEVREWVVANIGEIASSKEVLIEAGQEAKTGGKYRLLDESIKDGVMTINFTFGYTEG